MIDISIYKTPTEYLSKAFCQLAEKCFYSNLKVNVITTNPDFTHSLDRDLWVYSKKHFIPHGTDSDPFSKEHPIIISNKIAKIENLDVLMLVETGKELVLELLSKTSITSSTKKILYLSSMMTDSCLNEINDLLQKSNYKDFELRYFLQNVTGNWVKRDITT